MRIQLKKKILMLLSMSLLVLLPMGFQMGIFPFDDAEEEWEEDNQGERVDVSPELEGTLSEEFNRLEATASDSQQQPDQNNEGITPASIEIPAIDVEADIEEVGTLDNGQMGVPSDENGVAWFKPGTKPGGTGNAVMAGHVDSYEGPAIFFDLEDLADGDEIIVSDEEGKAFIFTVRTQESYPLGEAPMDDIFGSSDARHLNLITCAGTFNQEEGTHDERLVIYTELDEEKSDIEQEAPDAPTNAEVNDSFVSWHAVDDDDVAGYRVYRGELGDEGGEFEQVESVSAHERKRISDTEADPSEHSYYITSVDIHGQESEPSEKVSEE